MKETERKNISKMELFEKLSLAEREILRLRKDLNRVIRRISSSFISFPEDKQVREAYQKRLQAISNRLEV